MQHVDSIILDLKKAACVIADGAGSFLQIEQVGDVSYEFETIFDASYPGEFDTVFKHIGTKASYWLQ